MDHLDHHPTRIVPCNGCTACCHDDAVFLHPEGGDDLSAYKTEKTADGRFLVALQASRDCVYLDRKNGCTIWERRPTVCRELDCRMLVEFGFPVSREVARAVKRMARRLAAGGTPGVEKP